jgi:ferrous iron transport protein A
MTTISDLKVGDRATLTGYSEAGRDYRRKLLSLGLTPGVEVGITRIAPMGDPVEIRVRGFSLSLRKEEAATLNVERL